MLIQVEKAIIFLNCKLQGLILERLFRSNSFSLPLLVPARQQRMHIPLCRIFWQCLVDCASVSVFWQSFKCLEDVYFVLFLCIYWRDHCVCVYACLNVGFWFTHRSSLLRQRAHVTDHFWGRAFFCVCIEFVRFWNVQIKDLRLAWIKTRIVSRENFQS